MSLVSRSLSFSSSRILRHPACGYKQQHRGFAGAWLLRAPTQVLRVVNVVRSGPGEPYPSREFEICSEIEIVASNEVAPPLSNVFDTPKTEEVNILDDPAGFFRNRVVTKIQKVKQALQSVEESVAPSQFSPAQGDDVVGFFLISVFFILIFWVGNYLVPTWIFKETVFRDSKGNMDDNAGGYSELSEEEVDPADLIELPTNLQPFRGIAVEGFKAGRQKAREATEAKQRKKRSGKSK